MRPGRKHLSTTFKDIKRRTETDHPMSFLGYHEPYQPYVRQAINSNDALLWIDAKLEINQLSEQNTWERIPRSRFPKNVKLLQKIWDFKRKRRLESSLLKYKSTHLCPW